MKISNILFTASIFFFFCFTFSSAHTITIELQPGPEEGIDTKLNGYGAYYGYDGYMYMNFGAKDRLTIGTAQHSWHGPERTLIKFDSSEIRTDAIVLSATLMVYPFEVCGTHEYIATYEVLQSWGEGSGTGTDAKTGESSWFFTKRPAEWNAPGANAAQLDHSFIPMYISTTQKAVQDEWLVIPFNRWGVRVFQRWINGEKENNGFLMIGDERRALRSVYFYSSDHYESELRPKLILELKIPE